MVSDEPQEGRCNASITRRCGLEVHDSELDETYKTGEDGRLVAIVIRKGAIELDKEDPDYHELYTYFDEGFSIDYVRLKDPDADDDTDPVTIEVEDDDPDISHTHNEYVGFCERYPVKSEDADRCPNHGGLTPGAPEGNTNALTHGLKAKRSNYYQNEISDEDKLLIERFVDNWIELSSYTRDDISVLNELYRIAVDQIRLWNAQDEFEDGIVYEQYEEVDMDNDAVYTTQENPANLPYDRLDRTTYKKLKELGVLSDPESKKAEATESLAEKFAELE